MSDVLVESIEQYGLSSESKPKQLFSKVGIVGCGNIGQIIAMIISKKELEVVFIELTQEKVDEAMHSIETELDQMIENWGMTQGEKRAILSRISGHIEYDVLKDCDMVIEAIRSKSRERHISMRKDVFKKVEENVSPQCIIATNSTTIVITELSSELKYQDRCVSIHFLTNTPSANMVEVVRSLYTSKESYEKVLTFITMLGKDAIQCEESAGLISMRIYCAQLNEACGVLMEGVSSMQDIDKTMRIGLGQSFGPFEMADRIGLDKVARWMDNLYQEFGDSKYIASPIIKRLVRSNKFGRQEREGFYKYDEEGRKIETTIKYQIG